MPKAAWRPVYSSPPPKEPTLLKVLGVVDCLLFLLGCLLSFGAAFAFDAPGSENHVATWVFALTSFSLPVTCLVSMFLATVFVKNADYKIAQRILLLPLVIVLVFVINLAWMHYRYGDHF